MSSTELIEVIRTRRAVYPVQYNSEAISREEIESILEAANWAPTHRRTEPWRFKVFHGEAKRALGVFLAEKYKETTAQYSEFKHKKVLEKSMQSAYVIAICMQRDPNESVPEWEEVASTAMAVQNMWLTAHSMRIGSYWSSPVMKDYLGDHISLEPGVRCLGFFYLGKYDGELDPGTRKSPIEEKTTWIEKQNNH